MSQKNGEQNGTPLGTPGSTVSYMLVEVLSVALCTLNMLFIPAMFCVLYSKKLFSWK